MFPTCSQHFPSFSNIFQHVHVISPCFPLHFVGLRASRRVAGGIGFAEAEKLFRFDVEVPRSEEVPRMDEMLQLRFHNASHYSAEDYHNQIHIMDTYIYIPSTFASSIYRGHFMWTRFLTQEPSFMGFHPKRPYFVNPRFVSFEGSFGNLTPFIGSISSCQGVISG